MSKGHGQIINLSNFVPYVFEYNPTKVDKAKPVSYFSSPNIGGAFRKKYFTGFDNKEVSFSIHMIDMESRLGLNPQLDWWDQLTEPDPGLIGIAGSFFGNQNYPPPQILFQFGVSMIPQIWDVLDVQQEIMNFDDDSIGGIVGIAREAKVSVKISLDEDSAMFKANQIAKKVSAVSAGIKSVQTEVITQRKGTRKEIPGSSPKPRLNG